MPAIDAAASGEVPVEPTWTAPTESEALFPPPTWTAPIESDAVFVPPVPTFVGALTEALFPATLTDADGDELIGLVWTAPAELEDVLPPPSWTVPTELEAVLSPVPETDVGAETLAEVAGAEAVTDGSTLVDPTWTVPIELSATLSAAAVLAPDEGRTHHSECRDELAKHVDLSFLASRSRRTHRRCLYLRLRRLVRPLELKEIRMWPRCREQRRDAPAEAWDAQGGQSSRQGEEEQRRADAGCAGPGHPEAGSRRLGSRELGRTEPERRRGRRPLGAERCCSGSLRPGGARQSRCPAALIGRSDSGKVAAAVERLATSVASRLGMRDCGEVKGDLERCGWGAAPVPTAAWMEGVPAEPTVTVAPPAETARSGWAGGLATGVANAGDGDAAAWTAGSDAPPTEVETVTGPTVVDEPSTPSSANAEGAKTRATNTPTAVRRTSCLRSQGDPIPTNASPWVCLFL